MKPETATPLTLEAKRHLFPSKWKKIFDLAMEEIRKGYGYRLLCSPLFIWLRKREEKPKLLFYLDFEIAENDWKPNFLSYFPPVDRRTSFFYYFIKINLNRKPRVANLSIQKIYKIKSSTHRDVSWIQYVELVAKFFVVELNKWDIFL